MLVVPMPSKYCQQCNKPFQPKSNNQKYCCDVCWHKAYIAKQPEQICAQCGNPFHSQQMQDYCSYRCTRQANPRNTHKQLSLERVVKVVQPKQTKPVKKIKQPKPIAPVILIEPAPIDLDVNIKELIASWNAELTVFRCECCNRTLHISDLFEGVLHTDICLGYPENTGLCIACKAERVKIYKQNGIIPTIEVCTCPVCGTEFTRHNRQHRKKYCSNKCMQKNHYHTANYSEPYIINNNIQ
jgi:hypothetical protein